MAYSFCYTQQRSMWAGSLFQIGPFFWYALGGRLLLSALAAQDSRLAAAVNGSGTKNRNFSIGQGTSFEANQLGKTWVGDGATKTSVTRYVGITDDILKRGQAHLRQKGITIDDIAGLQNLSREDARAVEQTLINYHGLGKGGGTLINKINSISATRQPTKYEQALIRGSQLLKNAGYEGF